MLFEELEQQLLFNSLGGMLAGGMTASWIAGMAIVEGLRAVQDLWLYPSIAFKTYITGLVALSMGITGLFGVTLYHHLIKFFGDYDSVDRIYPLLRYHFVLCRVCVVLNHMQFSYGAFKVISRMRGLYLPLILMIVVGVLVLGSGLASGIAVYNFFQQTSYSVVQTKLGIWQAMFFMEFACHLGLTAMRAVYMYKANDIKAVITHAGHPIRYVADICLLVARTPTYNTIFALITMCVLDGGTFGTRYFLVFGGSQLALVAMFASASYTFSYLIDEPHHARATPDGEHIKGFPDELLAFNDRMHNSRLHAQRLVRPRRTRPKPIDELVEDEDEFASDGIKIEEITSPKGLPSS